LLTSHSGKGRKREATRTSPKPPRLIPIWDNREEKEKRGTAQHQPRKTYLILLRAQKKKRSGHVPWFAPRTRKGKEKGGTGKLQPPLQPSVPRGGKRGTASLAHIRSPPRRSREEGRERNKQKGVAFSALEERKGGKKCHDITLSSYLTPRWKGGGKRKGEMKGLVLFDKNDWKKRKRREKDGLWTFHCARSLKRKKRGGITTGRDQAFFLETAWRRGKRKPQRDGDSS